MQAVVPAAGRGTRLGSLTADRPKPMVDVNGKPLLAHCLDALADLGVAEFVVVVGYRSDAIRDAFGDAYGDTPIRYVHQDEPRGLADAVATAASAVDGPFVLCNGDNVFDANLGAVTSRHRETDASATLLVERVSRSEAATTGVCVTDEDGRLTRIVEKPDDPPSTLVTTGFAVFDPAIFHACRLVRPSERGEYELPDAVTLLLHAGHRVETVRLDGWRVNVNTPADRDRAARRLS